ncbi:MAG: hypothetical protein KF805_12295 [Phycisphaeraceae bacterium]|nr:hypothetical protein [Phycisphaeraceae bacterium]
MDAPISSAIRNAALAAKTYEEAIDNVQRADPSLHRGQATGLVNRERPDLREAWCRRKAAAQTR